MIGVVSWVIEALSDHATEDARALHYSAFLSLQSQILLHFYSLNYQQFKIIQPYTNTQDQINVSVRKFSTGFCKFILALLKYN